MYNLKEVDGCRQPNLVPMAFRLKKALRPEEALSFVREMVEECTERSVECQDGALRPVH